MRIKISAFAAALLAVPLLSWAEPKTVSAVDVVARLADGSRLIGRIPETAIPFRTAFGNVAIHIDQLSSIQFDAADNTASLYFPNGDRLKSVTAATDISMDTVFGRVALPPTAVREIVVHGPDSLYKGLVLHYTFDDGDGARTVHDESGQKNHAQAHGTTYVDAGKLAGARRFNGSSDFLQTSLLPASGGLQPLGPNFSFALWLKIPEKNVSFWDTVIACSAFRISLTAEKTARVSWRGRASRSSPLWDMYAAPSVPIGEWCHVAAVKDGNKITMYINGANSHTGTVGKSGPVKTLQFGKDTLSGIGAADYFKGVMDDLFIYSRPLTAAEVERLYER